MKPTNEAIDAAIRYLEAPMSAREQMEKILNAAYAAQFQSEEYAGLVKELRDGIIEHRRRWSGDTHDDLGGTVDHEKTEAMTNRAADAIEALLADRKKLTAAVLLSERQNEILTGDMDRPRDALAARLAPVEDEALVEIVAREMTRTCGDDEWVDKSWISWEAEARAAIAAIRPHIEAAEREHSSELRGLFLELFGALKKVVATHHQCINLTPETILKFEDLISAAMSSAAAIRSGSGSVK